jgi:hypothetical protein
MTTFNITRSNDKASSNVLLLGIAIIAILAVVVAFAPALFSSSVAVESAPFGFNSPQDGNFQFGPAVPTFSDLRLDGMGGTTAAIYSSSSGDGGWVVMPIPQGSADALVVPCPFTPPSDLDANGNAVLGQVGNVFVAYSSSANEVYFRSGGYETVLSLDTCIMSAKRKI